MGYLNAKATLLTAINCVCCGKPLLDAVSVETGIGPICRSKYMVSDCATDEQRQEANKLVFLAALATTSNAQKMHLADQVAALGFPHFGEIVRKRFIKKVITLTRGESMFQAELCPVLIVQTPYVSKKFNGLIKQNIDWTNRKALWAPAPKKAKKPVWKGWAVKCSPELKRRILKALEACFPGEEAIGPKGVFTIAGDF